MDLADIDGPAPLLVGRIELAQRGIRVEEAAAHARIAGDADREEVRDALAHRAIERADAIDDLGGVHAVAVLVEHHILDQAGVLAGRGRVKEVERGAVEERVAVLREVDVDLDHVLERLHLRIDARAHVLLREVRVDVRVDLRIERLRIDGAATARIPDRGAARIDRELAEREILDRIDDRDLVAIGRGLDGDLAIAPRDRAIFAGRLRRTGDADVRTHRRIVHATAPGIAIRAVVEHGAGRVLVELMDGDHVAGRRIDERLVAAVGAAIDRERRDQAVAHHRAVADQRQDDIVAVRDDGCREVHGRAQRCRRTGLEGRRREPRARGREGDVRQRLRRDHEQVIVLEPEAELRADNAMPARELRERDGPDPAIRVVRDELEVRGARTGREQRDVIDEHRARRGLRDRCIRVRPRDRDAPAPQLARYAGRRIPRGFPVALRGKRHPRDRRLRHRDERHGRAQRLRQVRRRQRRQRIGREPRGRARRGGTRHCGKQAGEEEEPANPCGHPGIRPDLLGRS